MLVSLVAVVVLPIIVIFAVVMSNRIQPESGDKSSDFTTPVATREQTLSDIKNLDNSVDKVKADTAAAKNIISAGKNHSKLSD